MYYDDFLDRLKKGEEPTLVLLFGDSEGVISEGFQILKEKFRKTKPGGSIQVFDGSSDGLPDILSSASTASLFATAQLLAVKNAQKTFGGRSEEAVQVLQEYSDNRNPDTLLVFLAPGMKKTVKAVSAMEKMGWTVQCSDMPEWKMASWLKQQALERDLKLPEDAVQLLIQRVGGDLAFLQRALEQLADYVYPRKGATLQEVKDLPIPGLESEIFSFLDAVGNRQTEKALLMISRLQDGVDVGTFIMMYQRIRELLTVSVGRGKGWSQELMAKNLGLHPFRLKNLWDQAAHYTTAELKEGLQDLIHLQAGVVTGRLGKRVPAVMLEWWILKRGKKQLAARS